MTPNRSSTVCWYDKPTVDDRMVSYGAITVFRFPIPVLAPINNREYRLEAIGRIEAVEDGWDDGYATLVVLGEVKRSALPKYDNGDLMYGVGMDLGSLESKYENGLVIITSARLMAISVTMSPVYPKAILTFPGDAL